MDWQTVTTVVELLLKTPVGRLDKFKKKKKAFFFLRTVSGSQQI